MKRCIKIIMIAFTVLTLVYSIAYAQTTGDYINHIYQTAIASVDKTALEEDLNFLEDQISDVTIIEQTNAIITEATKVKESIIESRIEERTTISEKYSTYCEIYFDSLNTTDLDFVISSRTQLQNYMTQYEILWDVGITEPTTIYNTSLFDNRGLTVADIQNKITAITEQLDTLDISVDYGAIPTAYPIDGTFTSPFGVRTDPINGNPAFHNGVDIAAPVGTPIKAWFNGTVEEATTSSGNGNYVVIKQGELATFYAHLDTIGVRVGEVIKQGDVIGTVGTTGRSTGPHLHLGLYINAIAVDPAKLVNGSGV